ncbi:MAG TPA: pilus assembly protein [Syntrophales bacterium]|nr:pilus assembly protein [Syntrophales bacterium]HQL90631.1 pilus assembly protein [Syntrophales bacterium]
MKLRGRCGRTSRGSTIVEFAIALLVFIILVVGIIEFGWLFFIQHTLQYATREGTRLALVGGDIDGPSGPMTRVDSIVRTIREKASLAASPDALLISIYPVNAAFGDPANWENIQDAGEPGDYMRVRTRVVHTFFTPLIGSFFPEGRITLQAEGTYRNELFDE